MACATDGTKQQTTKAVVTGISQKDRVCKACPAGRKCTGTEDGTTLQKCATGKWSGAGEACKDSDAGKEATADSSGQQVCPPGKYSTVGAQCTNTTLGKESSNAPARCTGNKADGVTRCSGNNASTCATGGDIAATCVATNDFNCGVPYANSPNFYAHSTKGCDGARIYNGEKSVANVYCLGTSSALSLAQKDWYGNCCAYGNSTTASARTCSVKGTGTPASDTSKCSAAASNQASCESQDSTWTDPNNTTKVLKACTYAAASNTCTFIAAAAANSREIACPAGKYSDTVGEQCKDADAGKEPTAGATSQQACGKGKYSTGGKVCVNTAAGKEGITTNTTAGTTTVVTTGATDEQACTVGKYSAAGAQCGDTAAGQEGITTNATAGTTTVVNLGATSEQACTAGKYSIAGAQCKDTVAGQEGITTAAGGTISVAVSGATGQQACDTGATSLAGAQCSACGSDKYTTDKQQCTARDADKDRGLRATNSNADYIRTAFNLTGDHTVQRRIKCSATRLLTDEKKADTVGAVGSVGYCACKYDPFLSLDAVSGDIKTGDNTGCTDSANLRCDHELSCENSCLDKDNIPSKQECNTWFVLDGQECVAYHGLLPLKKAHTWYIGDKDHDLCKNAAKITLLVALPPCVVGFERQSSNERLPCIESNCTATEVGNSTKSAANSIQGKTGETVSYTCDTKYTTDNTGNATAQVAAMTANAVCKAGSGVFEKSSCVKIKCPDTKVAKSDYKATGSIKGKAGDAAVAVTCDNGLGPRDMTCQNDGTWDTTLACA